MFLWLCRFQVDFGEVGALCMLGVKMHPGTIYLSLPQQAGAFSQKAMCLAARLQWMLKEPCGEEDLAL